MHVTISRKTEIVPGKGQPVMAPLPSNSWETKGVLAWQFKQRQAEVPASIVPKALAIRTEKCAFTNLGYRSNLTGKGVGFLFARNEF